MSSTPQETPHDRGEPAEAPRAPPPDVFGSRAGSRRLLLLMPVALLAAAGVALSVGAEPIPLSTVLRTLLGGGSSGAEVAPAHRTILLDLRLPRIALMAVTGGALAAAGATYQGLFRNPLADPYIVGVASGAGLGATLAITLGDPSGPSGLLLVPLAAFAGGVGAVALVLMIAQVGRTMPVTTMLLAGVAVGSFASAITTFWMLRSPDGLRRAFTWLLGGYGGGGWTPVLVMLPYALVGLVGVQIHTRALNVLQLDEEQARQLGIDVERVKIILLGAATLMTAAAVAFGGLLGFVGLVVPHVLRILGGPDYRRLVPLSAVGGAVFLILADLLARSLFRPRELPVGVITALVGAPFFIFLLRRLKRQVF